MSTAQPGVQRFAEILDTHDAERLAETVSRLPGLIEDVNELLPSLHSLESIAPDLREILRAINELGHVLSGVPGIERLRQRAEDQSEG